jgi:hypothetical protein
LTASTPITWKSLSKSSYGEKSQRKARAGNRKETERTR